MTMMTITMMTVVMMIMTQADARTREEEGLSVCGYKASSSHAFCS